MRAKPYTYLIYSDQIRLLSENVKIIKFADNTLVLELLHQHQGLKLQNTINNIDRYCQNHDLLINAGKTKALSAHFLKLQGKPCFPIPSIN